MEGPSSRCAELPPDTPSRSVPKPGGRTWLQYSSEGSLPLEVGPSTPVNTSPLLLSADRRGSVGQLLDRESREACSRNLSPQAPGSSSGRPMLSIECSPRISRRLPPTPQVPQIFASRFPALRYSARVSTATSHGRAVPESSLSALRSAAARHTCVVSTLRTHGRARSSQASSFSVTGVQSAFAFPASQRSAT